MDVLLFIAGAAVLVLALRWWRPEVPLRWAVGYAGLVLVLFAVPLATALVQVPVDLAYLWSPWKAYAGEGFEPQNPLLADVPLQMLPFHALVRQRLLDLEAPLWAHELGTGQPLLGNGQSAAFAPLRLMALPAPPERALTVAAAWQVLVGLLLTHALVLALVPAEAGGERRRRPFAAQAGAATGAVAFALSLFSVAWLYHPHSMVAMFLPGLVLGVVALARGERRAFPGLVACAVAMVVSGHPETAAHSAVAVAGLGAVLFVRGPRVGRGRFVTRSAVAALLAFALAAPAVLPLLEALPESERMSYLRRGGAAGLRPPEYSTEALLPVIQPLGFGSPRDGDWDGPVNLNELCTHYAGLLTLALALAGVVVFGGRILAIVAAGALALGVALNVEPLFEAFTLLPGMDHAANGRLRLLWVLAVAVAAGLTVARLSSAGRRRRLGVGAVVAGVAALALLLPPASGGGPLRTTWWIVALAGPALAAAGLALSGRFAPPAASRLAIGAIPAMILLDLTLLGAPYHPLVEPEHQLRTTPAIAWLQERYREEEEPFRVTAEGWGLTPNLGAMYDLWDPRGNDPMRPGRPVWLISGPLSGGRWRAGSMVRLHGRWPRPMLEKLGVRYVMDSGGRHPGPPWRRVYAGVDTRLFELPTALPLFYVPERTRLVDRPGGARAVTFDNSDFARLAVYTERGATQQSPMRGFRPPDDQEGEVWIRTVRANGFELVSRSREGALVASSVSDAPGWRLRIDGEPAPTLPVDWAFLGFRVPPGVHRVELTYEPVSWRWGLALFGLGALACLGWGARKTLGAPSRLRRTGPDVGR